MAELGWSWEQAVMGGQVNKCGSGAIARPTVLFLSDMARHGRKGDLTCGGDTRWVGRIQRQGTWEGSSSQVEALLKNSRGQLRCRIEADGVFSLGAAGGEDGGAAWHNPGSVAVLQWYFF